MSNFLFFDTETTGNTKDDFLCQLAYAHNGKEFSALYRPPVSIPPEASAVHHITNKMVTEKRPFKESADYTILKSLFENEDIIAVAHNAKFDLAMLAKEGIVPSRTICTLRIARHLDQESKIPRYNLQFLRYYLGIEIDAQAHDALGDVRVLSALFERLYTKMVGRANGDTDTAIKDMLEVSARPSLIPAFTFGKYQGQRVADVAERDPGYLAWLLNEKQKGETDEEDWIYTLSRYVAKR